MEVKLSSDILPRISNIATFILISFSILTISIDIYRYGLYNGIFYLNHFIYVAYTFNIIMFSGLLILLYIRYKHLGLPIFLITYSIWDGIGILKGIYAPAQYIPEVQQWATISLPLNWNSSSNDPIIKPIIHSTLVPYFYPAHLNIPYYQFQIIFLFTLILSIILYKKKILQFKLNGKLSILYFLVLYSGTISITISSIIPLSLSYNILTFLLCYYSIRPT